MSPCVGFPKRSCLGLQEPPPLTQSPLVFEPEVVGIYLPGTGILGWGPVGGPGLLTPEISLLNFYPPHMGEGRACSVSLPLLPVWMDVVYLIL